MKVGEILLCVQAVVVMNYSDQVVKNEGIRARVVDLGSVPETMIYVDYSEGFREQGVMRHPLNHVRRWVFTDQCYEDPNMPPVISSEDEIRNSREKTRGSK